MNAQVPQEILDQIPHAEAVAKLNATGHALAAAVPHPGQIRRMKLSDPRGPFQLRLGPPTRSTKHERGIIKVVYLANRDWPEKIRRSWGNSRNFFGSNGSMGGGVILLDHTRVTDAHRRVFVLLHEMLHSFGRSHVDHDEFPDTIMHTKDRWRGNEGHLKDLDKAALRALHSPLVPVGTRADTLRCDGQGRLRGSR